MPVGEVTAEWALWGEEELYSRYRVLSCSDGVLGQDVFRTVLTRYSPGTIASVPQVTVSWLSDRDGSYYLGMAIHDHSSADRIDTADREIIQTSYYCVPFGSLAAGAVSYSAMYERFRTIALPVPDGHPVTTTLATAGGDPGTPSPGAPSDRLAMRAASLLLTNRPVCILRAQNVSLTERLRFLDAVVALLPYGMRSQLSASTWASGTYREHKLRLFFGTSARDTDHPLTWGSEIDRNPIEDRHAHEYEAWLKDNVPGCVPKLARETEPRGFSLSDVTGMVLPRMPKTNKWTVGAFDRKQSRSDEPTEITSLTSVEELLTSCALRLRGKNPGSLQVEIESLRKHLIGEPTDLERHRYREIITEYALFNDHPIDRAQRADLYEVLLKLAFPGPLSYACYCDLEMIIFGVKGGTQVLHTSLADVIKDRIRVDSPNLYLLVLKGVSPHALTEYMRRTTLDDLVVMAATMSEESPWRKGHAWVICAMVIRHLTAHYNQLVPVDKARLDGTLRRYCYLAPALDRVNPQNIKYQVSMLTELLKMTHGAKLSRAMLRDILSTSELAPTDALFAAVMRMTELQDVGFAERTFTRNLVGKSGFDKNTRDYLLRKLPEVPDHGGQPTTSKHRKRPATQDETVQVQAGQ